ncbi:peptidyl-tRNA hydrolase [Metschnikowia bicuspidata var. bicuspidata NRRL YB-4993]|uniref:Peptidyl-tRNA hydrolase n=1 Tax=Metschnikowia bicuspidata var. bicuspidata NRRL YB-4993 TaxID=869754 RepID=A0A1A0H8H3_9ASCO|nr:peptidyl-tRNA hydrolase [Metschnikowia bicuspidata var. bicuspidata NRRL YB-4993]OBA20183.1 peptidyl-tRNA hydrolase [Metschnikowia bicuspidata var. bicuspidata NRRL YB-4993]
MLPHPHLSWIARQCFTRKSFGTSLVAKQHPPILFLGLGNPADYNATRHNVGHWAIEKMAVEAWPDFGTLASSKQFGSIALSESGDAQRANAVLAKTTGTYMNVLGPVVAKAWNKFKQQHAGRDPCLVILHDELQVPLGKAQVRRRGTSPRGHNGLRSVDKLMGNNYTKLAIGIGKAPGSDVADYVLSKFKKEERQVLENTTMPLLMDIMQSMVKGKHVYDKL